jgi:hypothetical protein
MNGVLCTITGDGEFLLLLAFTLGVIAGALMALLIILHNKQKR